MPRIRPKEILAALLAAGCVREDPKAQPAAPTSALETATFALG
ncbi:MAG TPA: hypothetical protein VFY93_07205 [Planctomycetota bacterium]|nr:hypothetical protein [Planctomycetota bacterium]